MTYYGPCFVTTDTLGNKYVTVFGDRTAPGKSWVEAPNGAIMQEWDGETGMGRGTTDPEGLYPQRKETIPC